MHYLRRAQLTMALLTMCAAYDGPELKKFLSMSVGSRIGILQFITNDLFISYGITKMKVTLTFE